MPIFCSANFESANETSYHDLRYIRLNNTPNHEALHGKLSAITGAEAALVAASGMAAISTTLLTVLKSGDHLLAQDSLYGGTHSLLTEDFKDFGISVTFVDLHDPQSWSKALRPETNGFYVETMTNPTVKVGRLDLVPEFCSQHGLTSMIDNTFASPVNFRPIDHGFDLSLHSATKYLNGHSDIVAGAIAGSREWIEKITHRLNHLGGTLDPHACFLLQRGLKTLSLRVERQNANALCLARYLRDHDSIEKVNYPGLEDHRDYAIANRLFSGFGGVLSFETVGGSEAADTVLKALCLPVNAPSLGGVETLVTKPSCSSHSGVPPEERRRIGVTDSLIRVAVGIEDSEELVADFAQALSKL